VVSHFSSDVQAARVGTGAAPSPFHYSPIPTSDDLARVIGAWRALVLVIEINDVILAAGEIK
jgi:hypothetical protein